MTKRFTRLFNAGLLSLACLGGTAQHAISEQTTNVIFKVKLKVEGNIPAMDRGIEVRCSVSYTDEYEEYFYTSNSTTLLDPGEIFTAPDGGAYLQAEITLPDMPLARNINPMAKDGSMLWSCSALPVDTSKSTHFLLASTGTAIGGATVGTCSLATGYVAMDGTLRDTKLRCATQ